MATLISCNDISVAYGDRIVLDGLSLTISEQERIGIIGPNGCGKSTLLKVLAGIESVDSGERSARRGLKVGYVAQKDDFDIENSLRQTVSLSLEGVPLEPGESELDREVKIDSALSRVGFENLDRKVGELSGGWRKRLAIAATLAREPELLLLDEPTNHLDLESVVWLEKLLGGLRITFVLVSHDRTFLQSVSKRVMEIDRRYPDNLLSFEGDYSNFLERRREFFENRQKRKETLDNKVRHEIDWLNHGPKARTSKSRSRIDEAHRLIEELTRMKSEDTSSNTEIDFSASGRKTKRLMVLSGIRKAYGDKLLISDLDLLLRPGLRLGVVGPNGCGKTTLLKLMAKELEADAGFIKYADNLQCVYFDQRREQLDQSLSLQEALTGGGRDAVMYRERSIHVISWGKRFNFRAEQMESNVGRLSGGEQAKLLIAKLMLKPADVLLMDEPTNDLDIPTLEVLEESLLDFPGSLVMVTHDRYMLDRVCDMILGLDGEGGAQIYAEYSQWQSEIDKKAAEKKAALKTQKQKAKNKPRGLTYMEQKEYEGIEAVILGAEEALEIARKDVEDPTISADAERLAACFETMQATEKECERLYSRWQELEAKLNRE